VPRYWLGTPITAGHSLGGQVATHTETLWPKFCCRGRMLKRQRSRFVTYSVTILPSRTWHEREALFSIGSLSRLGFPTGRSRLPCDAEKLQLLPGVGQYISSSIRCFAFGKIVAVVDTNVIRILDRVFSIRSRAARPRDDRSLWQVAEALISARHPREYNWALLDLGATVCTKRSPSCPDCPLQGTCAFRSNVSAVKRSE
jgi:hypothetical protein